MMTYFMDDASLCIARNIALKILPYFFAECQNIGYTFWAYRENFQPACSLNLLDALQIIKS